MRRTKTQQMGAAQAVKNAGAPDPLKFSSLDIQLGFNLKGEFTNGTDGW
jgi:hypothetical protein